MGTIYDKLKRYSDSDYYGFHMPGHKRNPGLTEASLPYEIDITEIEGFDDLHHAKGMLKEAQEKAAEVYHAEETHFLVNGSTAGILSAVCGVTEKGDSILVARNCHKSVYHAIYMKELKPVYLYPRFDEEKQLNTEISVQDVRDALRRHPQIRAVVIVSPTYDGVVSDVAAIAEAVHEMDLPLIVDEAHGAHFGFHPYFPENSNVKGADIVIHSLHKTLPSLTQTALLHMNGNIVKRERVRMYLDMLQTSSPSYVLMASIDACIHMLKEKREELFDPYVERLKQAREALQKLKRLQLIRTDHYDPSKLVLSVKDTDMTGQQLYQTFLAEYHLQMEMYAGSYVLAMTAAGDTDAGFMRLVRAAEEIDAKAGYNSEATDRLPHGGRLPELAQIYTSAEASVLSETEKKQRKKLPWEESAGYVSAEYAYLYPPGIPLIVPGEKIDEDAKELLLWYKRQGFSVEGLKEEGYIEVWTNG